MQPLFGFIGAFNVFLLSGFVLTGFFGFALLDRLGLHPLASFFGGYVLAFNPWMFERANSGHAAFNHVWIFLALILALLRMSERRTIASAALAGLCFGGTFLFAAYFGLLGAIVVAVYFVFELVRVHGWPEKLRTLTLGCAVLGVTLLCLLPGLIAYKLDQQNVASSDHEVLARAAADTAPRRLRISCRRVVIPSSVGSREGSTRPPSTRSERSSSAGRPSCSPPSASYLLIRRDPSLLRHVTRRHAVVFAAILLPFAYWSSLRRVVHVLGIPIPTLSFFAGHVTTYYRVYARIGVIVGIALVILAAPALDRLIRRSRWGPAMGCALLVLVDVRAAAGARYRVGRCVESTGLRPLALRAAARHRRPLPAARPTRCRRSSSIGREIYYQMFHRQPLYNIVGSGTGGTREDAIRIMSRSITDPNTPGSSPPKACATSRPRRRLSRAGRAAARRLRRGSA